MPQLLYPKGCLGERYVDKYCEVNIVMQASPAQCARLLDPYFPNGFNMAKHGGETQLELMPLLSERGHKQQAVLIWKTPDL